MKNEVDSSSGGTEAGRPSRGATVALILVAFLLVATFIYVVPNLPAVFLKAGSALVSLAGSSQTNAFLGEGQNFTVYSPLIQNGSADISYPLDYGTLSAYALSLVNQDRSGLQSVTLSPNRAGQQHADSMLKYDYLSHYDTQGYKPYMRYTLLGGVGADFENVAYISYRSPFLTTTATVEGAIKDLEYIMMYNDSLCCNNGHRDNILNPLHNRVSIGVAYNSTALFFDEDFENYYVNMSVNTSGSYQVTMHGAVLDPKAVSTKAFVTFDSTPVAETPAQLNAGPREYGPGDAVGGILPPCAFACPSFSAGITVYASSWNFTSTGMSISFSLSDFIRQHGSGVYTIYIVTGSDTNSAITSFSIFVG
jgi:uncharacterized protein YkwD